MKQIAKTKIVYSMENDEIHIAPNGLYVRDVVIDAGIGEEVYIGQISDIHLNYCNQKDFDEANPVLMSTYKNRLWCANGETVPKLQKALEFLDDIDQLVVNGDTLDYLSHGTIELMDRELWEKCPDVIATVGGHEVVRQMQGEICDPQPYDERVEIIKNYWKHDVYYVSKVIKDKVMIIGMFNDLAKLNEYQRQKLEADIELAREKGYIILIFMHEPVATHNTEHKNCTEKDVMLAGDTASFPVDFCDCTLHRHNFVGGVRCDAVTNETYQLIVNSADVVKGIFTAHWHNDMHLDIVAKNNKGETTVIPQFIHTASAYDDGHVMRIIIK